MLDLRLFSRRLLILVLCFHVTMTLPTDKAKCSNERKGENGGTMMIKRGKRETCISPLRVKVNEGILQGSKATLPGGKTYYRFLGIPYAEAPVGTLRFRDPLPKHPWSNILYATKEGNLCTQFNMLTGEYIGSENCLFLNIFTPRNPNSDNSLLPVMFYIHGGAFRIGSGSPEWFGPDFLISREVILVSINYRLGVFGFLSMDNALVPGNAGLKDQNLALQWVNKNIHKFGGDPNRVTMFGVSAGSASVEYHLLSPMSRGLFNKAILESGSVLNPWARMTDSTKFLTGLTKFFSINQTSPESILHSFQEISSEAMLTVSNLLLQQEKLTHGLLKSNGFLPVIEKKIAGVQAFIDSEPLEMLRTGNFERVPVISGFVKNEGMIFQSDFGREPVEDMAQGNFINYLPLEFDVDRIAYDEIFRNLYNESNPFINVYNYLSDLAILGGVTESLRLRMQFTDVNYLYTFNYNGNINYMKTLLNVTQDTVLHADEISYLAPVIIVNETNASDLDQIVRCRMATMWTNFAKTGNPTSTPDTCVDIKWPVMTDTTVQLLEINNNLTVLNDYPYPQRTRVWKDLYQNYVFL